MSLKVNPSKGFTCDCKYANECKTTFHEASCLKVPKCVACESRIDGFNLCKCVTSNDELHYIDIDPINLLEYI